MGMKIHALKQALSKSSAKKVPWRELEGLRPGNIMLKYKKSLHNLQR